MNSSNKKTNIVDNDIITQNLTDSRKPSKKTNQISDFTESVFDIKLKDWMNIPEIQKLLPTIHKKTHVRFIIENTSTAFVNALRRTLMSGVPTYSMQATFIREENTDKHLLADMIENRIGNIPLDQKTPLGTKFELKVMNKTKLPMTIRTSDIKILAEGGPVSAPFNMNIIICELQPNRSIRLSAKIAQAIAYNNNAIYSSAFNVAAVAQDIQPLNLYEKDPKLRGVSSAVARPTKYRLQFNTNGNINTKMLLILACEQIIKRLRKFIIVLKNHNKSIIGEYTIKIPGEDDTLGELIAYGVYCRGGITCEAHNSSLDATLTISCKWSGDIDMPAVLVSVADDLIAEYIEFVKLL